LNNEKDKFTQYRNIIKFKIRIAIVQLKYIENFTGECYEKE